MHEPHEKKICLITPGHPSKNPRLVKEADALVEAGYDVHVTAGDYHPWGHDADQEYDKREWALRRVSYGPIASPGRRFWLAGRQRIAQAMLGIFPWEFSRLVEWAVHYVVPELEEAAASIPANLYIAHNLPALPAATHAAEKHGAKVGFDAEDFHRGEVPENQYDTLDAQLTRWIEEQYMPECDYVTAASPGIKSAYEEEIDVEDVGVVLNVFSKETCAGHTPPRELKEEHPGEGVSLYWYSQTIGPGRGLEQVVRAMGQVPGQEGPLRFSLRGSWAKGYEEELRGLADSVGVEDHRIRHLSRAAPDQLIERAGRHDIGLALEQSVTRNREICITNKIFAYLLAGLPVLATDTPGQRYVAEKVPDAVSLCPIGDGEALGEHLRTWMHQPERLKRASEAAQRAGSERFNWETEREKFLDVVQNTLKEEKS